MGYDEEEAGMGDNANWAVNARALALKNKLVTAAQLKLDWNRETAILNAFTAIQLNKNLADSKITGNVFAVNVDADGTESNAVDRQTSQDEFGRPTYYYSVVQEDEENAYAKGTLDPILSYENASVPLDTLKTDLGLSDAALKKAKFTVYEDGAATYENKAVDSIGSTFGELGATVEVYETEKSTKAAPEYVIVVVNTYAAILKAGSVHEAEGDTAAYITVETIGASNAAKGQFKTDAFEEGDVILYTKTIKSSATEKIVSVEKAASTTGTITAISADKKYVRVDGEKTYVAQNKVSDYTAAVTTEAATIYTDTYGNIVNVDTSKATSTAAKNYAYIIDRVATPAATATAWTEAKDPTAKAQIIDLATGEIKVVDETLKVVGGEYCYVGTDCKNATAGTGTVIEVKTDDTDDSVDATEGKIVEYTVADDGTYTFSKILTDAEGLVVTTDLTITQKSAEVMQSTEVYGIATSATKLTVVDVNENNTKTKISTYTGIANFPVATTTAKKDQTVVETDKDGKITNIYTINTSADLSEKADVNYAVYTGVGETVGTKTYYNFVVNGETVSYVFSEAPSVQPGDVVDLVIKNGEGESATAIVTTQGTANNNPSSAANCKVLPSGTVKYIDDTFVTVTISENDYTVYFADSYKVIDGTFEAPATIATAPYTETTFKVGDTITIYKDAAGTDGKIAFIVKVNEPKE
jgi:hypothetical protein